MEKVLLECIEQARERQVFPGGVFYIEKQGKVYVNGPIGNLTYEKNAHNVGKETLYDCASLTKVFTWTILLQEKERGTLDLQTKVAQVLPEIQDKEITVQDLLTHRSHFLVPLKEHYFQKAKLVEAIRAAKGERKQEVWYECVNSILAGWMVERVTGKNLATLVEERIKHPLGLTTVTFNPKPTQCAPTEGGLQGIVHDEKARTLETPAGNAGLFSALQDMVTFGQAWKNKDTRMLHPNTYDEATKNHTPEAQEKQGLGWLLERVGVRGISRFPGMVGHGGFTGCALLFDREKDVLVVALTNSIFPERKENGAWTTFIEELWKKTTLDE